MPRHAVPCALALFAATACSVDEGSAPVRPRDAASAVSQASSSRVVTLDDKFLGVESSAPGFAGLYLDRGGRLQVHLKVGASAATARQAIGTAFPALAAKTPAAQIRTAAYSWRELSAWRDTVFSAGFDRAGVTIVDLDETTTKVFVGVATAADSARIAAQLKAKHVPLDAYQLAVQAAAKPLSASQTLQSLIDPPTGGLMIAPCTLGYNVRYNGVLHFLTASHCTSLDSFADGVVTGIQFYQPHAGAGGNPFLGPEVVDPPFRPQSYWGPLCPANELCRLSDAALIRYDNRTPSGFTIASTSYAGNWQAPGSITYTGQWQVQGEIVSNELAVGQILDQMGRITGWTWGRVTRTCFHTPLIVRNGTMYSFMCQKETDAYGLNGDSGSPVFSFYPAVVTLVGIVWGGRFDAATGTIFTWFSPQDYVRNDFSPFTQFQTY